MAIKKFIFQKITRFLSKKSVYIIKSLFYLNNKRKIPPNFDYVRYSTLELCYDEINRKKIPGSVAELGVYKGDFAKRLNQLFPERNLYLFDTYSGFSKSDIESEVLLGFSSGEQDFSDTSTELIMNIMPYPEKCIIKKGYFPDTTVGIEDIFCFISIDVDLFNPIYDGLKYFYPRLANGGYIFVHDFNNDEYKGVKQAVLQFCSEQNIRFVPIPDICGSIVITK